MVQYKLILLVECFFFLSFQLYEQLNSTGGVNKLSCVEKKMVKQFVITNLGDRAGSCVFSSTSSTHPCKTKSGFLRVSLKELFRFTESSGKKQLQTTL